MTTPPPAEIRRWAREHGYEVGVSGRIPASVRQAYDAAHAPPVPLGSAAAPAEPSPVPAAPAAPVPPAGAQEVPSPGPWNPFTPPVEPGPAPWGYYPPPPKQGTDGVAITALVLGFFGILGLVFGVIALFRIRRSGRPGRNCAMAGIGLSSLWIIGIVVALMTTSSAERGPDGQVETAGTVNAEDLQVGDCPEALIEGNQPTVDLVPCTQPHEAEVIATFNLEGNAFPGEDEVFRFAEGGCSKRIPDLLPAEAPNYGLFYLAPTADSWRQGDREVICLLTAEVEGEQLIGPVPRR